LALVGAIFGASIFFPQQLGPPTEREGMKTKTTVSTRRALFSSTLALLVGGGPDFFSQRLASPTERGDMKTKTIRSTRWALFSSTLTVLAAGGTLGACAGEFKTTCPEGTTQTGGGDVDEACSPVAGAGGQGGTPGAGSGGAAPGTGGGVPAAGSGGTGGMVPVPPGAECAPSATKCEGDAQQTCGSDGKWGEAVACEIGCDGAGSACVVPVQLGVGSGHACALLSDGTVRCWGDDSLGQLGQGAQSPSTKPVVVTGVTDVEKLFVGGVESCVVHKGKTASCWGDNSSEQIAPDPNGTLGAVRTPAGLSVQAVEQVSASSHVCILKNAGASASVQCKGSNLFGKLGNNSENDSASFVAPQGLPAAPTHVSNGSFHTCAALQSGAVFCWGYGSTLGFSSGSNILKPKQFAASGFRDVVAGNVFSCAVGNDNTVSCWGANTLGELGRGNTAVANSPSPAKVLGATDVKQMVAGSNHACMLKTDGTVLCWGYNSHNQLGNTCSQIDCDFKDGLGFSSSPVQVGQLTQVEQLAAGLNTTCALKADKSLLCWGDNGQGQLGNGQFGGSSATPTRVIWK
jgi:alpha-tubulin suppressor-like RCC1 family protein